MLDITLKTDEEILAFDVSDEALEIAAGAVSDKNFTFWGLHFRSGWLPGLITGAVEIIFPGHHLYSRGAAIGRF